MGAIKPAEQTPKLLANARMGPLGSARSRGWVCGRRRETTSRFAGGRISKHHNTSNDRAVGKHVVMLFAASADALE
jgi:hypothetical protein